MTVSRVLKDSGWLTFLCHSERSEESRQSSGRYLDFCWTLSKIHGIIFFCYTCSMDKNIIDLRKKVADEFFFRAGEQTATTRVASETSLRQEKIAVIQTTEVPQPQLASFSPLGPEIYNADLT